MKGRHDRPASACPAPAGAAALAALGVVAIGAAAWPFTVDDAWIVARYASRITGGAGYTMNAGAPTDGVTGPLWLLPMIGAELAGWAPMPLAKGLGLLASAAAAAWMTALARPRWAAWATALVVGLQPTLGIWGEAGLQTGLAALAWTAAAIGTVLGPRPRPWLAGGAMAAIAWLRPEAVVGCAALSAALLWRDRRAGALAVAIALAGGLATVAWRLTMFGAPLPLALDAKPSDPLTGTRYVGQALFAITGGIGLWPAFVAIRSEPGARPLAAAVVAHLLAVAMAGGDWMPGYRLVAPVLPAYGWLAGCGIARIARPDRTRARWLAAGVLCASCIVPALDIAAQLPDVRGAGAARAQVGRPLARWLGRRYDRVGLVDIGLLGYASGAEVVDLAGVTDPHVARAPGGYLAKRIDPGYLASRDPQALVLHAARKPEVGPEGRLRSLAGHPVERYVARLDWVRARFRVARIVRYAPDYYYVILEQG